MRLLLVSIRPYIFVRVYVGSILLLHFGCFCVGLIDVAVNFCCLSYQCK